MTVRLLTRTNEHDLWLSRFPPCLIHCEVPVEMSVSLLTVLTLVVVLLRALSSCKAAVCTLTKPQPMLSGCYVLAAI